MADNILNPWAIDSSGKIISIEHARKGEVYHCPVCKELLSYCKKGDGPRARIDHFKHQSNTNCHGGGESEIHRMAKEKVYEILRHFLDKHYELPITWTCPDCGIDMEANLLRRAKDVRMEHDLDAARPDIDLLDDKGNTIIAIEIVFTHDVEASTLRFYDNNNIVLVRIVVRSAEDCNDMMHKLQFPDSCNLCFNQDCKRGEKMQVYRKIIPVVDNNRIVGLAVALDNPFEEEIIKGLPFNEQDKRTAIAIAKEKWPKHQLYFSEDPAYPYALLKPIQTMSFQSKMSAIPSPFHTGLDKVMHERQVKAIRRNYAIRAKKSGGKRRR